MGSPQPPDHGHDNTGDIDASYTYDVFGTVRSYSGTATTEFTFTGEQNDPNGLEYLRARYYDGATGRFLSLDSLGGGYPYAAGNPVNLVDPTGLYPICFPAGSPDGEGCYDSAEVGLPSNPPDFCDPVANVCIWVNAQFAPSYDPFGPIAFTFAGYVTPYESDRVTVESRINELNALAAIHELAEVKRVVVHSVERRSISYHDARIFATEQMIKIFEQFGFIPQDLVQYPNFAPPPLLPPDFIPQND